MFNRRKRKKIYRANHSIPYANSKVRQLSKHERQKQGKDSVGLYFKKLFQQSLISISILMGVLLMQRVPESATFASIQGMVQSEIPFAKYNELYQGILINLFPFSYRVPAKEPELTLPVGGFGSEQNSFDMEGLTQHQLVNTIFSNIENDNFNGGIMVRITEGEKIHSFVAGVVIDKGVHANQELGNFITIQKADNSLVTVGLMENIEVSRLEHIEVGDVLGGGTSNADLGEKNYFYITIQNNEGEYINAKEYLEQIINEAGE